MKINNQEFWAILRANGGVFKATADAITEKTGESITRQGVSQRAKKDKEQLVDIKDTRVDVAETGMDEMMKSDNEAIKFKACETVLKRQGRDRGWGDKQELDIKGEMDMNFVVEFVDPDADFE